MFRALKRYQTPILVLVTVILPLAVYRAHSLRPSRARLVDKLVLAATAPVRGLLMGSTGAVSDAWYRYVDLVDVRARSFEIEQRNRMLTRELEGLEALRRQNAELRTSLKLQQDNPEAVMVAARVIGVSTSPSARTLEINRGALDQMVQGAPVIGAQGLVGLVQRVGWTSSEVLLVADEKMSLHAQILRTRARGRVRGQGLGPDYKLELTEVLRSDDLRPGDRVVTSGLGNVFPKGLPIGEVVALRTEPGVQHRVAGVAPYVDFARLEYVTVILERKAETTLVTPQPLRPPSLRGETSSTSSVAGQ